MSELEKERTRIRTEERTRISAKIVAQIGELLLEDLENGGKRQLAGGTKPKSHGNKTERKKPDNFHHKNNYHKRNNNHSNGANTSKNQNTRVNNGLNQNASQQINIYCSNNQQQAFHKAKSSCPKQSNSVKSTSQGKAVTSKQQNFPAKNNGPMHNQNANKNINIYCTAQQNQSFPKSNSSHPKQPVTAKPHVKKTEPMKLHHHNFQPKGNNSHPNASSTPKRQSPRGNNGPNQTQNANQHINIYCSMNQQQAFHKTNSGTKSKPQVKKPAVMKN